MTLTLDNPLSQRLRNHTRAVHEGVDKSVMALASFASLDGYRRFVGMQYHFHADVDALYHRADMQAVLPDLATRRRLPLVQADLADLGMTPPQDLAPVFARDSQPDIATALGWLYVVEGSNLGAAVLRKEVAKLGLSDTHGARHLAPAEEGPAAHWRAFTAALDATPLDAAGAARADAGALAAFARFQSMVPAQHG